MLFGQFLDERWQQQICCYFFFLPSYWSSLLYSLLSLLLLPPWYCDAVRVWTHASAASAPEAPTKLRWRIPLLLLLLLVVPAPTLDLPDLLWPCYPAATSVDRRAWPVARRRSMTTAMAVYCQRHPVVAVVARWRLNQASLSAVSLHGVTLLRVERVFVRGTTRPAKRPHW